MQIRNLADPKWPTRDLTGISRGLKTMELPGQHRKFSYNTWSFANWLINHSLIFVGAITIKTNPGPIPSSPKPTPFSLKPGKKKEQVERSFHSSKGNWSLIEKCPQNIEGVLQWREAPRIKKIFPHFQHDSPTR